jgi:hypothetical protein
VTAPGRGSKSPERDDAPDTPEQFASVASARDGLLLRANAWDWERLRYEEGQRVDMNVEGQERSIVVRAVLHCPGGEPETWAWLKSVP